MPGKRITAHPSFRIMLMGMILGFAVSACRANLGVRIKRLTNGTSLPAPVKDPNASRPEDILIDDDATLNVALNGKVVVRAPSTLRLTETMPGVDYRIEVIKLSNQEPRIQLLDTSQSGGDGTFRVNLQGMSLKTVLLVVAFKDQYSSGQTLVPLATHYRAQRLQGSDIDIQVRIDTIATITSWILIKSNVDIPSLTKEQMDKIEALVKDTIASLGSATDGKSNTEIADMVINAPGFLDQLSQIITPGNGRNECDRLAWDFSDGRQSLAALFGEPRAFSNISPSATADANGIYGLSPSLVASATSLTFGKSQIKPPVDLIRVSIAENAAGTGTRCFNGATMKFDATCPKVVDIPVKGGTWSLAVPLANVKEGALYIARFQALNQKCAASMGEKNLNFIWDKTAPALTLNGLPSDPSNATPLAVTASPADVNQYKYALVAGAGAGICDTATYGPWTVRTTPIADVLAGDGPRTICALARDSLGNESTTPVQYTWVFDSTSPMPGGAGAITTANVSMTGVDLAWAKASDAVTGTGNLSYTLYRSTANDIGTVANAEAYGTVVTAGDDLPGFGVTGLSPATTYYFNVVVADEAGNKSVYVTASVTTLADTIPPTPGAGGVLTTANVAETSMDLNWTKATDNLTTQANLVYRVYQSSANNLGNVANAEANGTLLATKTNANAHTVSGLTPATTYYFTVVVSDLAGNKAVYATKPQATKPDTTAPVAGNAGAISTANVKATSLDLAWAQATDNVTPAASLVYSVYRSLSNNLGSTVNAETNGTLLTTGTDVTALAVTGLSPATTYYFNIVVADAYGNKSTYATKAQTTAADTTAPAPGNSGALSASGVTAVDLDLNWAKATDDVTAQSSLTYYVFRSNTNNIGTAPLALANGTLLGSAGDIATFNVTGLSPGTLYYFNVIVEDAAGNKAAYNTLSQATLADTTAPMAGGSGVITVSNVAATHMDLSWTKATDNATPQNALAYVVYRSSANNIGNVANAEANGTVVGSATDISTMAVTGLSPATTYYFNIVVRDAAGNKAAYSPISQATASDSTGPTPGNAGTLSASNVTATSLDLSWTKASDDVTPQAALTYAVYQSASNNIGIHTDAEANGTLIGSGTNLASLHVTGLNPATTYYFNVVVADGSLNKSAYIALGQATTADLTLPTTGGFTSSTGVTATQFTLNWTAATDDVTPAASLLYFVCSGASASAIDTPAKCEAATQEMAYTANVTSLAISGKSPNTTYYYNVVVKDAAGNPALYEGKAQTTATDSTKPTAGTFLASSGVTATQFTLNWSAASDDVTPAASLLYFVCSGASATAIDTPAKCEAATQEMAYTANVTSLAITGKSPNTTYYYNVVVKDAAGNTALYEGKSQSTASDSTKPTTGTFLASSGVTATQFTLNWTAASDDVTPAASLLYFVCSGASAAAIDTPAKCEAATQEMAYTANVTSLTITGKSPNTTYYYNVVVKDAAGNTALYEGIAQSTASDSTKPTTGSFLASSGVTATQFTLNWSAASDDVTPAASLLYFVCSGASAAAIDTPAKCEAATQEMTYTANVTSLAITGKSPNTTYYYNVVVKDAAGNTALYEGKAQTTLSDSTKPTAGTFLASSGVTATQFTLNWSAASDDVTPAASLLYFVCSGASASAIDSPAKCEAATQEMAYTANVTSLAITGKSPNTTYYYNVVVKDAAGNSTLYEGKAQATASDSTGPTPGNAGTLSASNVTATSLDLSWTKASDDVTPQAALTYAVYQSASNNIGIHTDAEANGTLIGSGTNLASLHVTGLNPATTYYFNVVVADAALNKSAYAALGQATTADLTLPTPGGFTSSTGVTATQFTLNWTAASDDVTPASSLLYFVCSGASASAIDTPAKCEAATQEMAYTANVTSLAITGKSPNTTYYYNVVVKDAAGNPALYEGKAQTTATDSTKPTAGTFLASSGVTATQFTLNWSAASDDVTPAASLLYFVCSGASATAIDTPAKCEAATQEMAYTANVTSLAITGKSPNTTYYYNVVVKDAAGNTALYEGKAQSTSSDSTLPTVGTFLTSSGVTATQFTLNWTAASDDVTPAASLLYFVCSGASASAIDTPAKCEAATQEMAYTANVTSLAITGKSPNTTYYYNVVVKDAAGNPALYEGKAQTTASDSTKPMAGTFLASSGVSATQFTLNWSAASDDVTPAASLLYFVCSGASASAIDTPAKCEAATQEMAYTANVTSLAISGKSPNTTYYYNVVVKDAAGNPALYEGKAQTTASDSTKPTAGTFLASSGVTATQFTLNWTAATDDVTPAASLLYFVCSGANAAAIDTPAKCEAATQEMAYSANVTSLAITGKSPNTTYYYNVVAKDAAGNTAIYEGKTQSTSSDSTLPTVGTFLASSGVTATQFTLNWSAASDDVTPAASLLYFVCSGASASAIDSPAKCEAATQEMAYTANVTSLAISLIRPTTITSSSRMPPETPPSMKVKHRPRPPTPRAQPRATQARSAPATSRQPA